MDQSIKILKALSDETRIKIIILVSTKKICAKAIAKSLEISEAAVSQQIKILKESGLLIGLKRGYHMVYEVNNDALIKAGNFINSISSNNELINLDSKDIPSSCCRKSCKVKSCCHNMKEE